MANYPQKSNVPVATQARSDFNLSHLTIASQDFGLFMPISCQYLVPGDSVNIEVKEVTRLLPMVNPAYVQADSIVRAFVVPINYIFPVFNDFITGNVSASSGYPSTTTFRVNTVPHTLASSFRGALIVARLATANLTDSDPVDFQCYQGDTLTKYHFTWRGRRMKKVLEGLGYNFAYDDALQSADPNEAYFNVYNYYVSLLPLFAFIKFYLDWIVPARYANQYASLRTLLETSPTSNSDLAFSPAELATLFIDFASYLDNDYFTAAWKYPANVEDGSFGNFAIPSVNYDSIDVVNASISEEMGSVSSMPAVEGVINSLSLQSVGALQKMLNKGMITGNKIKDWLKSEFGIEPSKDALRMSSYLGMGRSMIEIGEVYSSSDTEAQGGAPLGSYAGRGNGAGITTFDYKADQHSILVITSEIIPHSVYYQGLHPVQTMLNRFDFFQPEFDNVGVRAISRKELFNASDFATQSFEDDDANYMNGIFGFSPQYSNLKVGFDNVLGDFRLKSMATDLSSWFAARKFVNPQQNGYYDNINANFCKVDGIENALGYDDLFTYEGTDIDHFYSRFSVNIHASRPMVALANALTLEEDKGKKTVGVNTNNNPNV